MFLIDVSPSMGETKVLELPPGPNGDKRTRELTRLEWVLEFVMLKIQEMVNIQAQHSVIAYTEHSGDI